MAETKLPPLSPELSQAVKARNVPTEALTYYSRALLYQDRGDKAKAAEYFRKALEAFPSYTEAKEGLEEGRRRPESCDRRSSPPSGAGQRAGSPKWARWRASPLRPYHRFPACPARDAG